MEKDPYEVPLHYFKRKSSNQAFAFNCFCSTHDDQVFKSIEVHPIDFSKYENRLLFLIRSKYNEKHNKIVTIKTWDKQIAHFEKQEKQELVAQFKDQRKSAKQELKAIKRYEAQLWDDINTGNQSFVIERRAIDFLPICIASFFDYESPSDPHAYRQKQGKESPAFTSLFIAVFPYEKKSQMILAYRKSDEKRVKPYINKFIKESEKKLQRRLTNLMLFHCETWVMSEAFYKKRIEACKEFFDYALRYSNAHLNRRRNIDLNLFKEGFCATANAWRKNNGSPVP